MSAPAHPLVLLLVGIGLQVRRAASRGASAGLESGEAFSVCSVSLIGASIVTPSGARGSVVQVIARTIAGHEADVPA